MLSIRVAEFSPYICVAFVMRGIKPNEANKSRKSDDRSFILCEFKMLMLKSINHFGMGMVLPELTYIVLKSAQLRFSKPRTSSGTVLHQFKSISPAPQ